MAAWSRCRGTLARPGLVPHRSVRGRRLPSEPEKVEELIGGKAHTWDDFLNFAKEFKAKSGGKTSLFATPNRHLWRCTASRAKAIRRAIRF